MDLDGRCDDLRRLGGLTGVTGEVLHWTTEMDARQLRALYGSLTGDSPAFSR